MSEIKKSATRIAAEMVGSYVTQGLPLDAEYIATEACKIAYHIDKQAERYVKKHKVSDMDLGK